MIIAPLARSRLAIAGSVVVAALGLSACTGGQEPAASPSPTSVAPSSPDASYPQIPGGSEAPPTPGSESSTPPPGQPSGSAPDTAVPTMGKAPAEAVGVAEKYVTYQENAESWNQKTPRSWLQQVKPLMTDEGFKKLADQHPEGDSDSRAGGNGYAWSVSHEEGYAVKVSVDCAVPSAAGDSSDGVMLQCGVTDQPVDKSGKPIPITQIPESWPYAGPQEPVVLWMVQQRGSWLIASDSSGQAS